MNKQRIAFIIMLLIKTVIAFAEDAVSPASDFSYQTNKAKTGIIIMNYIGEGGDVVVPSKIDGLPVVKIESFTQKPAQKYNSYSGMEYDYSNLPDIYSIVFPNTVTEFGENFYCAGKRIRKIVLPKKVKNIPSFENCENISEITMPEYAETLGSFRYCEKLKEIKLPKGIKTIGYGYFEYCKNLEYVILPETLINIESNAFAHCYNLKEIKFPASIKEIGKWAFNNCINLQNIEISAKNVNYDDCAFAGCYNLNLVNQKKLRNSGYKDVFRKK